MRQCWRDECGTMACDTTVREDDDVDDPGRHGLSFKPNCFTAIGCGPVPRM